MSAPRLDPAWLTDGTRSWHARDLEPIDGSEIGCRESWLSLELTPAEWAGLAHYDSTMPTGVIEGKAWGRHDRDGRWVGVYARNLQGRLEGVFYPVVIR